MTVEELDVEVIDLLAPSWFYHDDLTPDEAYRLDCLEN